MSVELGPLTLEHLTDVEVRDRARIARHPVPAMAGDLVQQLGRASVDLVLAGSFFGPDGGRQLAALRGAYRDATVLDLLADAAGEGYVAKVVVAGLDVRQSAGDVGRFDYRLVLVEYVELAAAPTAAVLPDIDTGLADEAAGYLDDVQNGLAQVSQLVSLTQLAGFGDPTTKASAMYDEYAAGAEDRRRSADALDGLL